MCGRLPYFTFIPMGKLVLNYARFSGTYPRIKYDRTVYNWPYDFLNRVCKETRQSVYDEVTLVSRMFSVLVVTNYTSFFSHLHVGSAALVGAAVHFKYSNQYTVHSLLTCCFLSTLSPLTFSATLIIAPANLGRRHFERTLIISSRNLYKVVNSFWVARSRMQSACA
jgi:hypothetical protein